MSQSLNLLGATLNSTTSVADFSNFSKVKVAVSNAYDAAARNDYVNNKITDLGNNVLKLSSSPETIVGGAITANKSYISVDNSYGESYLTTINGSNGLVHGSVIVLQAKTYTSSITVSNNQNIILHNGQDCILTRYNTLQLIYSNHSNSWLELSRTNLATPPIQAVISFYQTNTITLNVSSSQTNYPISLSSYVYSNNKSERLYFSPVYSDNYNFNYGYDSYYQIMTGYITLKPDRLNTIYITVTQDADTNYLAAKSQTLVINVNLVT